MPAPPRCGAVLTSETSRPPQPPPASADGSRTTTSPPRARTISARSSRTSSSCGPVCPAWSVTSPVVRSTRPKSGLPSATRRRRTRPTTAASATRVRMSAASPRSSWPRNSATRTSSRASSALRAAGRVRSWSSSVPTSSTAPSTNSARRPVWPQTSRKRGSSGAAPATMSGRTVVEHLAQRRLDGPKEAEQLFPAAPVALGRRLPGPVRRGTGSAPGRSPSPARLGARGVFDPHRKARNEPRDEASLRSLEEGDATGAEREDGVAVPILKALQERLDVEAVGDDDPLGGSRPEPVDLEEPFGTEGREPFGPWGEDVSRFREPRERREELLHATCLVPLAQEALGLTEEGPEPDRGLRQVGAVTGERQVHGDARLAFGGRGGSGGRRGSASSACASPSGVVWETLRASARFPPLFRREAPRPS